MKAERRQELRTNDLAQMLEELQAFFRKWGSYVVGGAVVVVIAIAFIAYRAKAADQQLGDAWQRLNEIQRDSFLTQSGEKRTDAEITAGFDRLAEIADATEETDLVLEALSGQARIAIQLSNKSERGADPLYLDRAERAYDALKDRLPGNPMAVAMALNGLVVIEADRFVLDGDLAHKERARKALEQLRDDPRFGNTPYQSVALERLNRLDQVFRRIELAPPPIAEAPKSLPVTPLSGPPESPQSIPLTPLPGPPGETGAPASADDPEPASPPTEDDPVQGRPPEPPAASTAGAVPPGPEPEADAP